MPVPPSRSLLKLSLVVLCATSLCFEALAQDSRTGPSEPESVRWRPAAQVHMFPRREAPASVLARNQSRISAQVSAVINTIEVDVGQQLAAGDLLLTLDPGDIELSLAQVQAQRDGLRARLRLAESQLKRARELKTNNFVSTDAVNQRTAEVVSLRAEAAAVDAQVEIARSQLAKTRIRSPFDAVVSARQAQLGELTTPGAPLFTLTELGGEQVAAQIPDRLAQALEAAPVERFDLQSGARSVPLRLLRISPVVSPQTRTREARFSFAASALPAGTEGRVVWQSGLAHLPPRVIVRRDGELGVFSARDGRAVFIPLPNAQEGRPARSSLAAELPVITEGQARLQPGQAVSLLAPETD